MRGKRLKKGDMIGIVAPANYTTEDKIERAVKNIEGKGYRVKLGEGCRERWFTFAGRDEVRARDIMEFFKDEEVDAILCLRGGFGSIRLLEYLDFEEIKRNPKIFVGFSDITTLHSAFQKKSDLITFHGPMAASNFFFFLLDKVSWEGLFKLLENSEIESEIKNPEGEPLKKLVGGKATGRSIGGNLVTFVSNMGTEYDVEYEDTILFIEEIGEPAYKIDRALTQLINSKGFKGIKGIILGDFNNCGGENENAYSLMELFEERLGNLGIPVIYNFKSGHCWPMMTLPMGAKIAIDADEGSIKILEKIVE